MLLTIVLTLLPILMGGVVLLTEKRHTGNFFLSKDYTAILKGICCLIVVYVHIDKDFGNPLQDMIGSFAYVCVTVFFLFSAYGMLKSVENKKTYLQTFWKNRLVALLIPCLLINMIAYGLKRINCGISDLSILYKLNAYVIVLLQWCVWFYIIERCKIKWFREKQYLADALLIAGVTASSICLYTFSKAENSAQMGWCYERMGLIWGVLLYRNYDKIVAWMNSKREIKIAVMFLVGGILGVLYLKYKLVYFWGAYLLKVVLGLLLITLLFTTTSNGRFGNKFGLWLGSISYEVYLSHGIVMSNLAIYFPKTANTGWFILTTVMTTIALSACLHSIGSPIIKKLRSN